MKFKSYSKKARTERLHIVVTQLKELFPTVKAALTYNNNWQFLIAVLMSAQTTDKQVNKVTDVLFKKYPDPKDYINLSQKEMEQEINSIGLYRNKAKNILATAKIIVNDYKGEIPNNMEQLIELHGVGRKTANVVLAEIFNDPVGIAVDTHVTRLALKFGIVTEKTPVKIENQLKEILPKQEWATFTLRMIEYGRNYSPAHRKSMDDVISIQLITNN